MQATVDEPAEPERDIATAPRERIGERLRDDGRRGVDDASVAFERVAEAVVVIG